MQQEKKYIPIHDEDHDRIIKGQMDGLSLEMAIYNAGYDRGKAQHPTGCVWVKADQKPEHNVGVLVFIPGEDNHITSGMWDISNEWVLLDEYRTPEEEVTHWMPLPSFPEGYTHDILSDEWVSTLKAIAKEEFSKRPKGNLNQSRADLIREANNRDLDGVGERKDAVDIMLWAFVNIAAWDKANNKVRLYNDEEVAVSELYNEYQKQNKC